jgi:ubiquinone biosynthesis protein
MTTPPSPAKASATPTPGQGEVPGFEVMTETAPPGLIRRFITTWHHLAALAMGGLVTSARLDEKPRRKGFRHRFHRLTARLARPFVDKRLVDQPFPVQFRRRLEMLGPTYIKLGQILSLREDILPTSITDELKNLLDRLPVVTFERYTELIAKDLGRPVDRMFSWIDPIPIGSASIAQTHRATTLEGDDVILKVVKPGIRETLTRDAVLLRLFGSFLQVFLERFQPKQVIREFVSYTLKEVDLKREADNAETFQANFEDLPDVVFPKIYRQYSSSNVLTMEFLDGLKPTDPRAQALSEEDRDRLVDLGAAAIIRMLYKDGFFHADLHPGNLLVLPGPQAGFIDLGMVGRFDDELRRTLLYYYYCLVMGDSENAARYLVAVATPGPKADSKGLIREVEEISRRWAHSSTFEGFSLGQLIMESVGRAGMFHMYFPVEMVLMVKALVTFEGVGQILAPGFDVAEVSRRHINSIFIHQFNPLRLAKETLRGAPEMVDALVKAPLLVTEGLRFLEASTRQPRENPLGGLRGALFAGFCMVAAAILIAFGGPWWVAVPLLILGFILILKG